MPDLKKLYQPVYQEQNTSVGIKLEDRIWRLHSYCYEDPDLAAKIAKSEAGTNGESFVRIIEIISS